MTIKIYFNEKPGTRAKAREVEYMTQNFHMYMCDICGFCRQYEGYCPHCDLPLSKYDKETQSEYQVDLEEAMRTMSEYKWYV